MRALRPRFVRHKVGPQTTSIKAAQYLRASTDHQNFSIENQSRAIAEYARLHKLEIIRTYVDPAKTGITMRNRLGLKRLISDVQSGHPGFTVILVYDVSRWGRFQDTDESAHYEYLCKSGGVSIRYCAELFDNDGALVNNIIKNMKRAMAGEYSRDLSARVAQAQSRYASLGYHQGGIPNFGLRRLVVDQRGHPRGQLKNGERKYLTTDRIVLVPGPKEETDAVREIFRMFVDKRIPKRKIARLLNEKNIRNGRGNYWTGSNINKLLRCERYIGNYIYNRTSLRLGAARSIKPPTEWVRAKNALKPIVDVTQFLEAQRLLNEVWPLSDNDLLDYLSAALCKNGFLSAKLVDRSSIMPTTTTYCEHFGSLSNAYRLIGYKPAHKYRYRGYSELLRRIDQKITAQIVTNIQKDGGCVELDHETHVLTIDNHLSIALVLVPYLDRLPQIAGWKLHLSQVQKCHAILLGRLDTTNEDILDFHLLPRCIFLQPSFRFTAQNVCKFDYYKLGGLSDLYRIYRHNYFSRPNSKTPAILPISPTA